MIEKEWLVFEREIFRNVFPLMISLDFPLFVVTSVFLIPAGCIFSGDPEILTNYLVPI